MEATRSCSQAHLPLQSISFPPQFYKKFQFTKSKPSNSHPRLVIAKVLGTGDNGDFEHFTATPNKIFMEEAIGAEYGEGFETFRPNGLLKVDVDFLNDRLQEGFLRRIRYAMKPDEAYGLIFSWDNVVADSRALMLDAWNQLASEEGLELPEDDSVQRLLLYATADHILHKALLCQVLIAEIWLKP